MHGIHYRSKDPRRWDKFTARMILRGPGQVTANTEQSINAQAALTEGRGGNKEAEESESAGMDKLREARHLPENVPQEDPAFTKVSRNMPEKGAPVLLRQG